MRKVKGRSFIYFWNYDDAGNRFSDLGLVYERKG